MEGKQTHNPRIDRREAEQALRDFTAVMDGAGRDWKLSLERRSGSGTIPIPTALMNWRAEIVRDVIRERARGNEFFRLILVDMVLYHVNRSRNLHAFHAAPLGADGPTIARRELYRLTTRVAIALASADGRPKDHTEVGDAPVMPAKPQVSP